MQARARFLYKINPIGAARPENAILAGGMPKFRLIAAGCKLLAKPHNFLYIAFMVLSVDGLAFRYPESKRDALKDVSFAAEKGEYIAVLGANGSGKSTLLRCIASLAKAASGAVRVFGEGAQNGGKAKGGARSVPTAVVFQSPDDQIVAETVELDAAFGPENLCLPRKAIRERVDAALSLFSLEAQKTAKTALLSTGPKQRLALAGAAALNPGIILLDEPSSMISEKDRDALLDFLDAACREGKTIFHVTHSIEEALRASRVLVLSRGALVFDGARDEFAKIPAETLAEWSLLCREKSSHIMEENAGQHKDDADEPPLLACSNLAAGPFCDVSFGLYAGKITAVTGESGSGKSLLLLCLAGIAEPEGGELALRAGSKAALAVQESEAALFEEFVADDVAFAPQMSGLLGAELKAAVREAMDAAGLPFDQFADRKTFSLSGGEKRKAAIAGIIATGGDVLLFDEPFSALDAKGRGEIMELFRRLAKGGKAIMFTANRKADCEGLADNIVCLDRAQKPQARQQPPSEAKARARKDSNEPAPLFAAMPPVAKFLCCALAIAATLLIARPLPLVCCALFLLITARQAGISLRKLFKAVFRVLPWLLLVMAIQCFYLKSASDAALFFLRFLCLLAALSLFAFIAPPTEISCGAEDILAPLRLFRIPVRNIALLISLVFRFFPTLYSEAEKIKIARRVRIGASRAAAGKKKGKIREAAALIVPIVMRTLAKAEKLSLAITVRYYTSGKHTRLLKWKLRPAHAAFIILFAAFSALLVYASRAWM